MSTQSQLPQQQLPQTLNHAQILEQYINFSLQQHLLKDKVIEDLQQHNTALLKQLTGQSV